MGVVDFYDAITSDRSYHKGMSKEDAFNILRKEAKNGKLDQTVVDSLIKMINA